MQSDLVACDIVELIAALAQKMSLRTIAEGIETARQAVRLLELGYEYGQGYYFSQPMEPKAAERFMRQPVAAAHSKGGAK
jgi:EAL domain-containing protein (putative c-di-GMP-specific phosphodiesterase class I)